MSGGAARRAIDGSTADRDRLVVLASELQVSDTRALDDLLDATADRATTDLVARELLLRLVHQLGLSRPAITGVVTDVAQVDDVVQNTLVAVERGIAGFEGRARFRTWLHRVARNEALMHLRSLRSQDRRTPSEVALPASPTGMSSMVAQRLTLNEAIAELPPHYRDVIVLRARDGCSYEDIAARLGIELNTVRSRLNKARALLTERLGDAR